MSIGLDAPILPTSPNHEDWIKKALRLADKAFSEGEVPVGAVIVKDGVVLSTGWTDKPGFDHAEKMAIQNCQSDLTGSSLYVTLEPCCHYGRTPPCTDLIINSGISEIYISVKDHDKRVNGKGIQTLLNAG